MTSTDESNRTKRRRLAGWWLVVLGVILNPVSLSMFTPDGFVGSSSFRRVIVIGQLTLVLVGIGVLRRWDVLVWRRGTAVRLLAAATVAATAILIAEVLVQLELGPLDKWAPPPIYVGELTNRPSDNFVADPLIGWRMRPDVEFPWRIDDREHAYRATSEGFRSRYTASDLVGEENVVAVIGDSFAFGTGVDGSATFPSLLDRSLEGFSVHNLALPGMGLDQMWMLLRSHALPLHPRVVVVAFIDNDWDRSLTAYRAVEGMAKPTFILDKGGLRPATEKDSPAAVPRWLERHSSLFGLSRALDRALGYRLPVGSWWATNVAILEAMAEDARQAGVAILFVRLPLRRTRPFPSLARYMSERGLNYLDLSINAPAGIHFATDSHINEAGHAYAARALEPEVLRLAE